MNNPFKKKEPELSQRLQSFSTEWYSHWLRGGEVWVRMNREGAVIEADGTQHAGMVKVPKLEFKGKIWLD